MPPSWRKRTRPKNGWPRLLPVTQPPLSRRTRAEPLFPSLDDTRRALGLRDGRKERGRRGKGEPNSNTSQCGTRQPAHLVQCGFADKSSAATGPTAHNHPTSTRRRPSTRRCPRCRLASRRRGMPASRAWTTTAARRFPLDPSGQLPVSARPLPLPRPPRRARVRAPSRARPTTRRTATQPLSHPR